MRTAPQVLVLVALTLGLPISSHARSSAPTLPLHDYEAQLDRYASAISLARRDRAKLEIIRLSMPATWHVQAADTDIDVSTDWLTTAISELERSPKQADERARAIGLELSAMRKSARDLEESSREPPHDPHADLDTIFRRKEFADLHGPTALELLEVRISRWLGEQLLRVLSRLHISATAGNALGWAVIAMAFLALCCWLWSRFPVTAKLPESPGKMREQAIDTTLGEWLNRALAAAERSDYREAIRCGYWAAVTRLENSGFLPRNRSRTPRECLRELASSSPERRTLAELTRHFELVWYGYRPASADDWKSALVQLERMGCLDLSTAATASS